MTFDKRARWFLLGCATTLLGRTLMNLLVRSTVRAVIDHLNHGDYHKILHFCTDDFTFHFHRGDHRWSGDWHGRTEIEQFLKSVIASRLNGNVREVATSGPPWALRIWVRYDDHADSPAGDRLYENHAVLVLRARWWRIFEQHDYFAATENIVEFDRKLTELEAAASPAADPVR